MKVPGAIVVIVYNPKGKAVYTQQISPKLIKVNVLIDKLEDFFMDLSVEQDDL